MTFTYTANLDYHKADYCEEKNVDKTNAKRVHVATISKTPGIDLPAIGKKIPVPKMVPATKDPMCGLHLGQEEDGRIIVTGMKVFSPFSDTTLRVGFTVLAINGVTDFNTVEEAEQVISEAEDKVSIIFADISKDGKWQELV